MELIFSILKKSYSFRCWLVSATICLSVSTTVSSQISKSPLMGWASWNNFGVNINEDIIKSQADGMVASGLAASGYKYINIDDGFFNGRYSNGTLRIDSLKFPHGMKAVADYIHSKGLKAGMYSEAGANTCGSVYNRQAGGIGGGLYDHDQQDVDLFFKTWGYDFLKVDFCGAKAQLLDEKTRYTAIKKALDNTDKKDISYNVCRWQFPGSWVTSVANSWRISEDVSVTWSSVMEVLDKNTYLAAFSSQGHYNDMDMLEIGRGLTTEEDKSYFSMWCILSAPLVLGNDLTTISEHTKDILTNAEVIAVDQDTTGLQGHLVSDNGKGLQVWTKNLHGKQSKERAVVFLNKSSSPATMTVKWDELNLVGSAKVHDLWSHTDLGKKDSMFTATIPSHGVIMLKVVGNQTKLQEVFEAEYSWINNYNLTQNSANVPNQGSVTIDPTCSGGAKVISLGNNVDNYIEFRDIYSSHKGNYLLTLSYCCSDKRSGVMSVNGIDTLLTNLSSGSQSKFSNLTFSVSLAKGYNTIRFSNAKAELPDIDKIQLDLNSYSGLSIIKNSLKKIFH